MLVCGAGGWLDYWRDESLSFLLAFFFSFHSFFHSRNRQNTKHNNHVKNTKYDKQCVVLNLNSSSLRWRRKFAASSRATSPARCAASPPSPPPQTPSPPTTKPWRKLLRTPYPLPPPLLEVAKWRALKARNLWARRPTCCGRRSPSSPPTRCLRPRAFSTTRARSCPLVLVAGLVGRKGVVGARCR